jgi:hypothetical protein
MLTGNPGLHGESPAIKYHLVPAINPPESWRGGNDMTRVCSVMYKIRVEGIGHCSMHRIQLT